MTTTQLQKEINTSSSVNAYVELFSLDTTVIGGPDIFHFTPMLTNTDVDLVFQRITYTPFPVQITGMQNSGNSQAPPQPTLTVSNVNGKLMQDLLQNKDLVGSKFTRIRTFRNFLDDGGDADPNAHLPPDIFYIEQKQSHTKQQLTFVLRSPLDRQRQLPRRQILRDQGFPGAGFITGQFGS